MIKFSSSGLFTWSQTLLWWGDLCLGSTRGFIEWHWLSQGKTSSHTALPVRQKALQVPITTSLLPQLWFIPCSHWTRDSLSLPQDSANHWYNETERMDYEMKTEVLSVLKTLSTSSPKPQGFKTQTCLAKKENEWPMHSYPDNLWELL